MDYKTIISDVVATHLAEWGGLGGVTVNEWKDEKNVPLRVVLNSFCEPISAALEKELIVVFKEMQDKIDSAEDALYEEHMNQIVRNSEYND